MTKVDIDLLQNTSTTVRTQNARIRDAFQNPTRTAKAMDTEWSGSASQNAMQAFYKLCQYTTPRYNVLENFAKAIDTIATGYVKTESTNASLADRFK